MMICNVQLIIIILLETNNKTDQLTCFRIRPEPASGYFSYQERAPKIFRWCFDIIMLIYTRTAPTAHVNYGGYHHMGDAREMRSEFIVHTKCSW